ncbi:MAG: hypothetical protein KKF62_02950 [Bacteroidetes bacterium]|nr:hypothetical protein [Bacteroidota bacterium]MBU1115008.1 hypothetical protein [Bacteroidota bacterium]MBU1799500.1 hypothetical protein [Bacteroidota bacterium]
MYLVKDTSIFSNKKLYKVGDKFPYSDSEKHLLWNLTEITEPYSTTVAERSRSEEKAPKETETFEAPKVDELNSETETPKIEAQNPKSKSRKKQ